MTASVPAATVAARPAEAAPGSASSDAPALNLMVQIAAVSHAADAETLASALRHDGFAAIVRTTTGDPYFHVQIGPFGNLQSAKAMRAKLASNGYNAFIKP
jgi:DedD protein